MWKPVVTFSAMIAAVAAVLFCLLSPDGGVVYQSPWIATAVALIGLGLCKQARDADRSPPPAGPNNT